MKKIGILFFLLSISKIAFSQEEEQYHDEDEFQTILGNNSHNGGYGALTLGYAAINDRDAVVMGARGAWVINHGFAIGLGGAGFMNDFYRSPFYKSDVNLAGGYGGLLLEPIILPKFPVHIALPVLLGGGGIAFAKDMGSSSNHDWDSHIINSQSFLFAQPGVELELNLTRHVRIAFGGYYMFTSKIDLPETQQHPLNAFSGQFSIKLGSF